MKNNEDYFRKASYVLTHLWSELIGGKNGHNIWSCKSRSLHAWDRRKNVAGL